MSSPTISNNPASQAIALEQNNEWTAAIPYWLSAVASNCDPTGLAELRISIRSANGWGVPVDFPKWKALRLAAAAKGHPLAISRCHKSGDGEFVADRQLAYNLAKEYSEKNPWDLDAVFLLASYHFEGIGVPVDKAEAARLWQQAAEAGHGCSLSWLGGIYDDGEGVDKDASKCFHFNSLAAAALVADGMNGLACAYRRGVGTPVNFVKAAEWYGKAAEMGQANAMNKIGEFHWEGKVVEKSDELAVKWWRKSAEMGEETAMFHMGEAYEAGRGVEKNGVLAKEWYEKAAAKGSEEAKKKLEEITEQ